METDEDQPSWEEAVRWYRTQATAKDVRDNYFDLPVLEAAKRFASSREFAAVHRILQAAPRRTVLDLGAGNGIASYALAVHGWSVHALEPDPSDEVGAGAIRGLAETSGVDITVCTGWGEQVPLPDATVAAVHARQVLHHLRDLPAGLREVERVLTSGGLALCTREHVADTPRQLEQFLANHPLHHRYGGEHAFALHEYLDAAAEAGLVVERTWGQLDTPINAYPLGELGRQSQKLKVLARTARRSPSALLSTQPLHRLRAQAAATDETPGRLFAFLLRKP